jgi:hypothetical protein
LAVWFNKHQLVVETHCVLSQDEEANPENQENTCLSVDVDVGSVDYKEEDVAKTGHLLSVAYALDEQVNQDQSLDVWHKAKQVLPEV